MRPWQQLLMRLGQIATLAFVVQGPVYAASLPATGQADCYDETTVTSCQNPDYPGQDGGLGTAGLSYNKLDAAGNTLEGTATAWSCTLDNLSGLVWEVKTADGGLRDYRHRYAWSNSQAASNGGDAGGTTETAVCGDTLTGQACTTENYIAAVNALNLCGANDWRLPTQRELLTLIHSGALNPAVDSGYLPNTANDVYWSASTYSRLPAFAWGVHFGYGAANADFKTSAYRVRLVRGASF